MNNCAIFCISDGKYIFMTSHNPCEATPPPTHWLGGRKITFRNDGIFLCIPAWLVERVILFALYACMGETINVYNITV
jgi:hypothetical protein